MFTIRGIAVLAILILSFAESSLAVEPVAPIRIATQSGWVKFDVISGRITAHNARHRRKKMSVTSDMPEGAHETFSVSFEGQRPAVHYNCVDSSQTLLIDIVDGDELLIRNEREINGIPTALYFDQTRSNGVTLGIKSKLGEITHHAPGFWHLTLLEPEFCQMHLVPLLEILRPDWRLIETAEKLEESLLQLAADGYTPPRQELDQLVRQLGSVDFRERRAADLALRRQGQILCSYFKQMDPNSLTAEQRHRIRSITRSLKVYVGDTPQRITSQLAGDPGIYLMLLERDEVSIRELATVQLERLQGKPIRFDPLGSDAERIEQAARLRRFYLR